MNLFCILQFHTLHFILKHLVYAVILCWWHFLRSWTHWYLILQFIHWDVTLSCISIRIKTLTQTDIKTDILTVIQLMLLFFEKHLNFAADLLEMLLLVYWQVHDFIKTSVFVLSLFHVLVIVITDSGLFFRTIFSFMISLYVLLTVEFEKETYINLKWHLINIVASSYLLTVLQTLLQVISQNALAVDSNHSVCLVTSSLS